MVVRRGVVDGQQLDDFHTRCHCPVYKALEVAKVAHTIAVLTAQGKDRHTDTCQSPRGFAEAQGFAIEHQHLSVSEFLGDNTVITLFPRHERMCCSVHHHIFIFYRHQPPQGIDRQHPLAIAHIVHQLVARRVPRANGRMTATDGNSLTFLQLGCRDAEEHRTTEQGHTGSLHLLATRCMLGGAVGIAIEMVRQRAIAPLVWKDVVLRGIKEIDSGHHIPLLAQHLAIGILHLIAIADVRQRMVTTDQCCRLQRPQLSVFGQHDEVLLSLRAILAMVADDYMHAFTPCCIIVYREFQFHGLQTFLQKYEIIMNYAL